MNELIGRLQHREAVQERAAGELWMCLEHEFCPRMMMTRVS